MSNKILSNDIYNQLNKQLAARFNVFGSTGSYNKSRYTNSGKLKKGLKFSYKYQYELLDLLKNLQRKSKGIERRIFCFIRATNNEYIQLKQDIENKINNELLKLWNDASEYYNDTENAERLNGYLNSNRIPFEASTRLRYDLYECKRLWNRMLKEYELEV